MTPDALFQVIEATWPSARSWRMGALTLRDGAGGGRRVSAAICDAFYTEQDLVNLDRLDDPLVLIRATDRELDTALEKRGWKAIDPVMAYAAPVSELMTDLPALAAFAHWPPLAMVETIWEEGGIGPSRLAVMRRVSGPKVSILARQEDRPAGVCFVACHGATAMVHALEVRSAYRRKGVGMTLVHAAANWAASQSATLISLVVTEQNTAARALYARIGMKVVGHYHYRMK